MSSGYEIYCHFRTMDPALSRDIDWYCSQYEPPTPEWEICVGLTPLDLTWYTIESDSMDDAVDEAASLWVHTNGEPLGPDEDLIWQAYLDGELIDEEMLGVYPEKVNRL